MSNQHKTVLFNYDDEFKVGDWVYIDIVKIISKGKNFSGTIWYDVRCQVENKEEVITRYSAQIISPSYLEGNKKFYLVKLNQPIFSSIHLPTNINYVEESCLFLTKDKLAS